MFPSKNPLLYLVQVLGIIALVGICMVMLGNPLALLALLMLPEVPLTHDPEKVGAPQADLPEGEGGDYNGTGAGFTGRL